MDVGRTVKPVSAAQAGYARPGQLPMGAPVATELDSSRSVTVTGAGAGVADHDQARTPPDPQQTARDVLIDPQTREVIFRVMSARSGKATGQEPEEAKRKLAAYSDAEREKRRPDGKVVEITA
jgi:hypothetical protein